MPCGWELVIAVGRSVKVSGSCGLWEGMEKYFWNNPKELAFVVWATGVSDAVWFPTMLSICGSESGGGMTTSDSVAAGSVVRVEGLLTLGALED